MRDEGFLTSDPLSTLKPGDVLDGRFRIDALLGGGGMAQVYRATHLGLEQSVAIKVLSDDVKVIPGIAARFVREAKAATQLKGNHIVRVFDVGTTADQTPYMVMELLEGQDLGMWIESTGAMGAFDSVSCALQTCEALAEVHGRGIVHRDLKPGNLFLVTGTDGLPCVKVIDFGISRIESPLSPTDMVGVTQPDAVMGSPKYMSPEQMEGAAKADARSDIWALGVVLYELLTATCPYDGDSMNELYTAALLAPPTAPSELREGIPEELDAVVLKCLRVDPNARYADVIELAAALAPFGPEGSFEKAASVARVMNQTRGVVAPRAPTSKPRKSVRRHRRVMELFGLAAISAVGMVFGARAIVGHSTPTANAAPEPVYVTSAALPVPTMSAPVIAEPAPIPPAGATVSATAEPPKVVTPPVVQPWRSSRPVDLFEDRK